jgi:formylglycine-generating enzyme required for sulfatase activity
VETVSWYDALVFCNKLSLLEELTPAYRIPGFNNSTDPADWGDAPSINDEIWNAAEIVDGSTGYRLPTEAQWEYACRAGTITAFNWETDYIDDRKANYDARYLDANNTVAGTYLARTSEVGSYPPNKWGLCDMHGNVWEWCGDWYGTYANGAQTDPVGASSGSMRVIRGGYWFSGGYGVRSAYRGGSSLHIRANRNGLRLIRPGS